MVTIRVYRRQNCSRKVDTILIRYLIKDTKYSIMEKKLTGNDEGKNKIQYNVGQLIKRSLPSEFIKISR